MSTTRNGVVLCPVAVAVLTAAITNRMEIAPVGLLAVIDVDKATKEWDRPLITIIAAGVRQFGQLKRKTVNMFGWQRVVETRNCRCH
jgi:hypothetical protein